MKILKIPLLVAAASSALMTASLPASVLHWDGLANTTLGASANINTATRNRLSGGLWDNGATPAIKATWTAGNLPQFKQDEA